eukprot:CAMPEP_0176471452 /NCGR_PEP_ID=MMETSP0127-20121128/41137_1 /TAXON_ID=938130 /ORGANISM="Platyophrya macrostoma, Strain WH" /LENGTH=325 /DNA_ID=CAMNT_0017866095 /DNA_START=40 /DNA_END=1017 /DNA_ORIENTATION=-
MNPVDIEVSVTSPSHKMTPRRGKAKVILRKVLKRLIFTLIVRILVFAGEMTGGLAASSLAIIADASEKLSDVVYMSVSVFAVWISTKKANDTFSFGYYRAGVIGSLVSTVIMWIIAGVLVYIIHLDELEVDGRIMCFTAIAGFTINVIVMIVLTLGMKDKDEEQAPPETHTEETTAIGSNSDPSSKPKPKKNQNLRTVILDIMGDMIMSILTIIASILCWLQPDRLKLADPICSMFFPVVCFFVTKPIIQDSIKTLMEGCPSNMSPAKLKETIMKIPGVIGVHDLHIWALSSEQSSMSAHVKVVHGGARILEKVTKACHPEYSKR